VAKTSARNPRSIQAPDAVRIADRVSGSASDGSDGGTTGNPLNRDAMPANAHFAETGGFTKQPLSQIVDRRIQPSDEPRSGMLTGLAIAAIALAVLLRRGVPVHAMEVSTGSPLIAPA
jgi:hypothetical protein